MIYLIVANSFRIIDNEIKKIVKDNVFFSINLNKSNIDEVIDEASYLSFLGDKKYIVVSNANFFNSEKQDEKTIDKLTKYLENPNPNSILIFTTSSIDSRKKATKIIKEKYNLINISPWDKRKTREEAEKYLRSFGYNADYNTLSFIMDNTYNNIDILYNELDKIMLYYNKACTINIDDVTAIVGREVDSNSFHFVNSVIEKDLENSIRIMNNLKVYKIESISLIMLLAREYRLMYAVKELKQNGKTLYDICKNLSMQDWQVNKLYNNSLKYQDKELLDNLVRLSELDLNIKKGLLNKDTALYNFLLESCI